MIIFYLADVAPGPEINVIPLAISLVALAVITWAVFWATGRKNPLKFISNLFQKEEKTSE